MNETNPIKLKLTITTLIVIVAGSALLFMHDKTVPPPIVMTPATAPAFKMLSSPTTAPTTRPAAAAAPVLPVKFVFVAAGDKLPIRIPSKTGLFLQCGGTYNTTGIDLSGSTDVIIDLYGDLTKPLPRIVAAPHCNAFIFDADTARIQISAVTVTSAWTPAKDNGGYAYHAGTGSFGVVRGNDITIKNVQLEALNEGIYLNGANRIHLFHVVQSDPLGMLSRCLMVLDGNNVLCENCSFTNSINQSVVRATGTGLQNSVFRNCNFGMIVDSHGRMPPIASTTIRQANWVGFENCTWTGGCCSFNTDDTGRETELNCYINGGSITGTELQVHKGCSRLTVTGLTITNYTGSEDVGENGVAGNCYNGLQLFGANSGIKSYGPSRFVYMNCVWTPIRAGLPLIKGDLRNAVNGGGNVIK